MSTNYYWVPIWDFAGAGVNRKHIGKSSGGWCFGLCIYPDDGIWTLEDWIERWDTVGSLIINEYNEVMAPRAMYAEIAERAAFATYKWTEEYPRLNHATQGPHGLLRHKIEPHGLCVSHGPGTWDHMIGEFS